MPSPKVGHYFLTKLQQPYKSYDSPISTDMMFEDGANIMTNIPGYLEKRPAFSLIAIPGTFTGTVRRIYLWHRVSGTTTTYFGMVNSVDGSNSYVYKLQFGSDTSAALLHTCTTSNSPFDFVTSNQTCYFGKEDVSGEMWKYDGTNLWTWGIAAPSVTPTVSLSSGSLNVQSGWYYYYTYGRSATGHMSSVSPLSACTGGFTGKQVGVLVTASTDPQVDQIHVFRTTDGGSTNPIQMQELPNSPFANTTATITDTAPDVGTGSLLNSFAPAFYANNPPPACRPCAVSQNRIWAFNANKVYYSGYEEIASGVPEESWPGGLDGNYKPYASPIYAIAPTSTGCAFYASKKIYGVDGDSLDTFRWSTLMDQRGAKYKTNVLAIGSENLWMDTSKQFWTNDIGEIGKDLRVDFSATVPSLTQVTGHNSLLFNWIVVMDGQNQKLLVANVDNQNWMVPWPISGITAIASGETADGVVDLLAAINGQIYKIVPGTYSDPSGPYKPWVKTNLFTIAPDEQPDFYGVIDYVSLETDGELPVDVRQLNDDDPHTNYQTYTSIVANAQASTRRSTQGTSVIRTEYPSQPQTTNAQRVALYIEWPVDTKNLHLYSLGIKYHHPANE